MEIQLIFQEDQKEMSLKLNFQFFFLVPQVIIEVYLLHMPPLQLVWLYDSFKFL